MTIQNCPDTENSHFYTNLLNQFNGCLFVTDIQSRFICTNKKTANLFGYKDVTSMLGMGHYDMRCPAVECAEDFISQDQFVTQNKLEITMLDIHEYVNRQVKIFLTKKIPYQENNQVVGSICQAMEIQSEAISKICATLIQSDKKYLEKTGRKERTYTTDLTLKANKLSTRQLECLFYILRGKSMKEIGKKLQISHRTVETHLEEIKTKLKCKKKSDLIEYSIANGYFNYIPKNIFSSITKIIHHITP
jgi:DNA-binding CsgD family transcriptional regulator